VEQARADEVARRRARAAERVRELVALRSRLATGGTVTPEDVELAVSHAEESRVLAEEAHEHAAEAHHHAALAHTTAAEMLELMGGRDGGARAAQHRDAARTHLALEQADRLRTKEHGPAPTSSHRPDGQRV